jgi:hypothetical protein
VDVVLEARRIKMKAKVVAGLAIVVLLVPSLSRGAEWVVHPTGDVNQDGDNIQAAIDNANPGDTIILAAGTFVLGKYLEEDASWVTVPRGSFRYFQDFSFWDVRDPVYNPWYVEGPDTPPFPQVVVVDKSVAIVGANPPCRKGKGKGAWHRTDDL